MGKKIYYCETTHYCTNMAEHNYIRTKREQKGWPDKRQPIALCQEHAADRKPLTQNQIDTIMTKINLKQRLKAGLSLLILCLSFVGCVAQNLETIRTDLPKGSILQVGDNKTVVPADPNLFKGPQGIPGPQGPAGSSSTFNIPGIETAPAYMGVVTDGKGGLKLIETNRSERHGGRDSVDRSIHLDALEATRELYYVAISGTINSIDGELEVRCFYTNNAGQAQTLKFPPITTLGNYHPGLLSFSPQIGTSITLLTEIKGQVNYDIRYNINQQ